MNINKLNKDKLGSCEDLFEYTKLNLLRMLIKRKHTSIKCLIEWKNGDSFLGDFVDIGLAALYGKLVVYTKLKESEEDKIFYLLHSDLECCFTDENDNGDILRTRIKFKDIRITFKYEYVDYKEYIESEEWKHKRKEVLERDKFKCRLCGTKGTEYNLHVHHNSYNNLGNEPLEDLITLCKECHERHHKN